MQQQKCHGWKVELKRKIQEVWYAHNKISDEEKEQMEEIIIKPTISKKHFLK